MAGTETSARLRDEGQTGGGMTGRQLAVPATEASRPVASAQKRRQVGQEGFVFQYGHLQARLELEHVAAHGDHCTVHADTSGQVALAGDCGLVVCRESQCQRVQLGALRVKAGGQNGAHAVAIGDCLRGTIEHFGPFYWQWLQARQPLPDTTWVLAQNLDTAHRSSAS